jgi:hypothetical protein
MTIIRMHSFDARPLDRASVHYRSNDSPERGETGKPLNGGE